MRFSLPSIKFFQILFLNLHGGIFNQRRLRNFLTRFFNEIYCFLKKYILLFFPLGKTTVENKELCTTIFHLLPNISLYKNLTEEYKA